MDKYLIEDGSGMFSSNLSLEKDFESILNDDQSP